MGYSTVVATEVIAEARAVRDFYPNPASVFVNDIALFHSGFV